jgi:hypothetical protein
MAFGAAIWRVHLVMAHQAIGHLGKCSLSDCIRFLEAAVTRGAWILRVQVRPDVMRIGEILSGVDRGRNRRRNVAQLEMLLMAEFRHYRGPRRLDLRTTLQNLRFALPTGVTRLADGCRRKIIILHTRAGLSRRMARHALQLLLQMDSMRERRRLRRSLHEKNQS